MSDHPRIRGEHCRSISTPWRKPGSSPHTRGARRRPEQPAPERGIIPAYAGSTRFWCHRRPRGRDHPRIRGEHGSPLPLGVGSLGSSPHTRGARRCSSTRSGAFWIIPAYAGSTGGFLSRSAFPEDHPRIRGEHITRAGRLRPPCGSSPHTRGAPDRRQARQPRHGIIPAYAGSTRMNSSKMRVPTDHPRIRGEHLRVPLSIHCFLGSSPHTRGAPGRRLALVLRIGIIPAYAGSTEASGLRTRSG